MFGLFFDVRLHEGHLPAYFGWVDQLRETLAGHPGLIWLERFKPLGGDDNSLLSHQLWRDEASIRAWRNEPRHRHAQQAGRQNHFAGYRIRLGPRWLWMQAGGALIRDNPASLPPPEAEAGCIISIHGLLETLPQGEGWQCFASVSREGWGLARHDRLDAGYAESTIHQACLNGAVKAEAFIISRDYGLADSPHQTGSKTPEAGS